MITPTFLHFRLKPIVGGFCYLGAETPSTVKTVPTEIQSPKSAEIKSVYVAFHVHAQLQRPVPTEIYSPVQSFFD